MEKAGIPVPSEHDLSLSMYPYGEHFILLMNVTKLLCGYSIMGICRNLFFFMLTFPQARVFNSFSSLLSHLFLSHAKKQWAQPTSVSYQPVAVIRSMFQQHGLETPPSTVSVLPVTIYLLMAINEEQWVLEDSTCLKHSHSCSFFLLLYTITSPE